MNSAEMDTLTKSCNPTSYDPKVLEIPEGDGDVDQIFKEPNFTQLLNDSDTPLLGPIDIDDEHLRSEFTPALQEQEHTSVLNIVFQHENVCGEGNLSK